MTDPHVAGASREPGLFFPSLAGFYATFSPVTYALLRIAFGLVILTHGLPKALGTSHGTMANPMAGATNMIANVLHLPAAPVLAVAAMLLETVGAIGVAAGILTRFFAAALAVEMLVICFAHAPTFAWIDRGFEYPMVLGFVALHIAIKGGGGFAVDRLLPRTL
jgi:putative oxidoreductase